MIGLAVRWYLRSGLSYGDVEELLSERGIAVDTPHCVPVGATFTSEFTDAAHPARHATGDSWLVDETAVRIAAAGAISTAQSISTDRSSTSWFPSVATPLLLLASSSPAR
jgi:transposase-like protein